jgi:CDP-diacylglycerol--glycerol-3-phosphate 3-phosphatidyltransferase
MLDRSGHVTAANARFSVVLPQVASDATLCCLDHVARRLVTLGVSANAVSVLGVGLAAVGGVLLSLGHFGLAAVAMVAASLSDALDGLVARCASVSGSLLDASADRYEEFFFIGGMAVFFRGSIVLLVLALFALAGSFMVSYGSAKAESLGIPVPSGAMRRAERAVCLCLGAALSVPLGWLARGVAMPGWISLAPAVAALAIIAVVANVSAIRRLSLIASLARGLPEASAQGGVSTPAAAACATSARRASRIPERSRARSQG